jgi:hypothetical protein
MNSIVFILLIEQDLSLGNMLVNLEFNLLYYEAAGVLVGLFLSLSKYSLKIIVGSN